MADFARFSLEVGPIPEEYPLEILAANGTDREEQQLAHESNVMTSHRDNSSRICAANCAGVLPMIIEGRADVMRRDRWNTPQLIATVEAGNVLGELSMIDGEPRFAACVAAAPTLMAVLSLENLARIIVEQTMLGAKILRELGLMLSRRLRVTTVGLMELLDERGERAGDLPLAYRAGSENGPPV